MLQCLDSTNIGIVNTSLKNLAEFAVLSQGALILTDFMLHNDNYLVVFPLYML